MPTNIAAVLIVTVLGTLLASCTATTYNIQIGLLGQTCLSKPITFGYRSFTYSIAVQQNPQLGNGCSGTDVLLSPLYMENTCINPQNNNKNGCPSGGTTATGTHSSTGSRVPVNSTNDVCNDVFIQNGSVSNLQIASTSANTYDSGIVSCAPSRYGYFYFQNNCPVTSGTSLFNVQLDYSGPYSYSCGGSSSSSWYYDNGSSWPVWATWTIVAIVFLVVLGLLFVFGRRRRRMQQQQAQVQMMPMPPPPPPPPMYHAEPPPQGPPPGYPPPSYAEYAGQNPAVGTPAVWFAGGKPPQGQEDLLNEIKSRIESGQSSFSALAKELSACPSGKQGGDIGWIRRGTTVAEFEAASFNASPGDLVTCSTQFGLHLLKVVDQRQAVEVIPYSVHELGELLAPASSDSSMLDDVQLIDVREGWEAEVASLPGFTLMPLSQFGDWGVSVAEALDPKKETIVLCHHGVRSMQAAQFLVKRGFTNVRNVTGGIDAYSRGVDSSIPTY